MYELTENKIVESALVNGLTPSTVYYFIIRTITESHESNSNIVYSEFTDVFSAETFAEIVDGDNNDDGGGSGNGSFCFIDNLAE